MQFLRGIILLLIAGLFVGKLSAQKKVAFFLSPSCMICRFYAVEMRELHALYAHRGIEFTGYAVGPLLNDSLVDAFRNEYSIPFNVVRDNSMHRVLGATITPEVFVTINDSIVYHGRIDDSFVRVGKRRAHVKNRELRDAIESILQGRIVQVTHVPAVGCIIEK